jgi:hypothetical protein
VVDERENDGRGDTVGLEGGWIADGHRVSATTTGSDATMAAQQRRERLISIRDVLDSQREVVPTRCTHCGRDAHDRDHELVQAALRARIRVLEARVWALEAELVAAP